LARTDENPKTPRPKVPDELTKSWLKAQGFEKEVQEVEAKENMKTSNPVKRTAKRPKEK